MKQTDWISDKDYNFIFSHTPRPCVDLVIKTKDGVLLSRRLIEPYKNTWHFPGGRVRFRETTNNAINRLAMTELGCKVKVGKLLGFMEFLREKQAGQLRHSISLAFLVQPLSKKLLVGFHQENLKFFKKTDKKIHSLHAKFLREQNILK
jgi:ADP-ribose pyrophosphatase YjhB (NUDIX family)